MRLDQFDLNLLVAFDLLLQEQNVTKAAQRAHVTQSAMSAALKRLRDAFQDDILAQQGRSMIPTPYALAMHPGIIEAITLLRSLIARKGQFDPAASDREFKIAGSDYIATVLLAPLLELMAAEAPGVRLDISLPTTESGRALANGELDLFVGPEVFLHPDHPSELIFEEQHVAVGWSGNPLLETPLTREKLFEMGHVGVSITGSEAYIDAWMREAGLRRRIEVRAPSFLQVPFLILNTQRLGIMHRKLAQSIADRMPLRIMELPFSVPPMREMLQYHVTRKRDPGLVWLRDRIRALVETG